MCPRPPSHRQPALRSRGSRSEGPHRARRARLDRLRASCSACVLVLVRFAGADEPGSSAQRLVALGAGFALLAIASCPLHEPAPARGRSFPEPRVGLAGLADRPLAPGITRFDVAGWVWPVLLARRRRLVDPRRPALARTTGRAVRVLYPALVVLLLIAVGGAFQNRLGRDLVEPGPRAAHLSRQRPPSLPPLRRFGRADGRPLQRPRREDAELGLGAAERLGDDARLRVRPRRRRLERRQRPRARTVTSWPPTCTRSSAPHTSPGRTCSPGTRSAASTRSSTPSSIRARSPVSR